MKKLEHLAFIMDGNRRWADEKGFPRVRGHKEGIFAIERVIEGCINNNINYLTLFAFSTENWDRSKPELTYLSRLMYRYLWLLKDRRVGHDLLNRVKISFIGDKEKFGERNLRLMLYIENHTRRNKQCHVIVAVSYGGRDEIVFAVNRSISAGATTITKKDIEKNLYLPQAPFPDMIVRTGNELRISNFLTWQSAYSELLFLDKLWPEIEAGDIDYCKEIYDQRDRKFGK